MIQTGAQAAEVDLPVIQLANETSMDDKLVSLIVYVQMHPHVVSVEFQASKNFSHVIYLSDNRQMQGTPLGICIGLPKSLSAIANFFRVVYSVSWIDWNRLGRL